MEENQLTHGKLVPALVRFTVPIFLAMLLQVAYGAVDLLVVGQFATMEDVSGVTTGSQMMQTVIALCTGLSMGTTILLGQLIGAGEKEKAGRAVGVSLALFGAIALALTAVLLLGNGLLVSIMQTPAEALAQTSGYLYITSCGTFFIVAYNLIGSIFRGIGDAKTPLIAVGIACVINVVGDLVLVAGVGMGAQGAACATVLAQSVSVLLSLWMLRGKTLPFVFHRKDICFAREYVQKILMLGVPIALQNVLVSVSFLAITAIINVIGVAASAAVGVTEKVVGFVMLLPSAFAQSLSAFAAQNYGAGKTERAKHGLFFGMGLSLAAGVFIAVFAAVDGEVLLRIFTSDAQILSGAVQYLRAYSFDIVFVCIMFCMTGYFNGCGKTTFVMVQAIMGAFGVRIPLAFFLSQLENSSLFLVGLATPASTLLQIVLCVWYYRKMEKSTKPQPIR